MIVVASANQQNNDDKNIFYCTKLGKKVRSRDGFFPYDL
jgi:hypothetical protein